jgi:hypothetical protein
MLRGRNRILEEDVEWGAELRDVHCALLTGHAVVWSAGGAYMSEENADEVFVRKR